MNESWGNGETRNEMFKASKSVSLFFPYDERMPVGHKAERCEDVFPGVIPGFRLDAKTKTKQSIHHPDDSALLGEEKALKGGESLTFSRGRL